MKFLWTWMSKNPKFSHLADNNPVNEERLLQDDWKIEEIKAINDDLIAKFESAKTVDPTDVDL